VWLYCCPPLSSWQLSVEEKQQVLLGVQRLG